MKNGTGVQDMIDIYTKKKNGVVGGRERERERESEKRESERRERR